MADNKNDKGLTELVRELWELVVAYLKQETLEPIKGLGRFLMWGVLGSLLLGIGVVLLALALLRGLQTLDSLDNNLSFVPYLAVIGVTGAVAGLAATRIGAEKNKGPHGNGRSSADVLPTR